MNRSVSKMVARLSEEIAQVAVDHGRLAPEGAQGLTREIADAFDGFIRPRMHHFAAPVAPPEVPQFSAGVHLLDVEAQSAVPHPPVEDAAPPEVSVVDEAGTVSAPPLEEAFPEAPRSSPKAARGKHRRKKARPLEEPVPLEAPPVEDLFRALAEEAVSRHASDGDQVSTEDTTMGAAHGEALNAPEIAADQASDAQPAVPIDESVQLNHLICLEDGKPVYNLRSYLKKMHNMDPAAYRRKWGLHRDYPMIAPNAMRIGYRPASLDDVPPTEH